mgnify:CR=1 FL=1
MRLSWHVRVGTRTDDADEKKPGGFVLLVGGTMESLSPGCNRQLIVTEKYWYLWYWYHF